MGWRNWNEFIFIGNTKPWDVSKIRHSAHGSGVYILMNRQKTPIYVGKSTDLQRRLLQHYYSDKMPQVCYFQSHKCSSDKSVECCENWFKRQLKPYYNEQGK